ESEVVNFISERRNVWPFAGINIDGKHVLAVEIQMRREVERERRVTSLVFPQTRTVDPDGRGGHYSLEVHRNVLATRLGGQLESPLLIRFTLRVTTSAANEK